MDSETRVGSIASAAFLVLWIIASTMVSAVFTVRYMGIVEATGWATAMG